MNTKAHKNSTGHKLLCTFAASVLCVAAGVFALMMSGCDEIDQMADNANKRPPVQSLMPPQIDTDPEAHQHLAQQQQQQPANNPPAAQPNSTAAAPQANPPASQPQQNQQPAQPAAGQPQAAQPQAAQPAAQAQPGDEEMMTLDANTGKQGQGYGGGLITEPVHEFFSMRNLITWDQIKHDMDIWQAIHNRYPKNAQEFQKEILEPANIELPELPPGNRYVYDPKTGELLVARKKPQ